MNRDLDLVLVLALLALQFALVLVLIEDGLELGSCLTRALSSFG